MLLKHTDAFPTISLEELDLFMLNTLSGEAILNEGTSRKFVNLFRYDAVETMDKPDRDQVVFSTRELRLVTFFMKRAESRLKFERRQSTSDLEVGITGAVMNLVTAEDKGLCLPLSGTR